MTSGNEEEIGLQQENQHKQFSLATITREENKWIFRNGVVGNMQDSHSCAPGPIPGFGKFLFFI